ncbi:MAG: L-threonylcarbamoyladenylate synthase [Defluviitaleaceae bacterium]|nr:L-threonylcarbamoyladenylate synthase [Defluviitaleaceae bacterium]
MDIEKAAEFIRMGKLVAFPTETVYGLGGDGFNPEAVAKIYAAKGRPGDNPLILHIANEGRFNELAHNPPEYAYALIKAFWPGPLTLVVQKKPHLPRWLGGHPDGEADTVGIRMPIHSIARALIEVSNCFIAAPSANKAGKPSPTTAAHVREDFPDPEKENMMILEGDSVDVGLESTVVDITGGLPRILRPGAITPQMIYSVTKLNTEGVDTNTVNAPRAPGMKYRHYAPRAPLTLLSGSPENIWTYVMKRHSENLSYIGVLGTEELSCYFKPDDARVNVIQFGKTIKDYPTIANTLFSSLRKFDTLGVDMIFAQAVPDVELGTAIMDRMTKAAEGRVVNV